MKTEAIANEIVCYSIRGGNKEESVSTTMVTPRVDENPETNIFTYLVYGQMYAFFKSQYFNLTTDNPFPSGEVNRVVKKFQIHEFK